MAIEDDDKPKKKISHEIGQDLSLLSVEELTERIALMNSEIERLQAAMTRKRASKPRAVFSNREFFSLSRLRGRVLSNARRVGALSASPAAERAPTPPQPSPRKRERARTVSWSGFMPRLRKQAFAGTTRVPYSAAALRGRPT